MPTSSDLRAAVRAIDGRDYGAYQDLRGTYAFDTFELEIAIVPKDPFAPPGTGVFRVRRRMDDLGLATADVADATRSRATRDFLCRRFHAAAQRLSGGVRGTGWSGLITVGEPGQAVLDRNAVVLDGDVVEVRAFVGLPGRGRRVQADLAETVLLGELPAIAASLPLDDDGRADLDHHLEVVEDAQALRGQLVEHGLVAFVADGAVLPRRSGIDDRPLATGAVPVTSPASLQVTLEAPHAGPIPGMGIPAGVTVIVGGGYHGKSTLLTALATGVHDHVPGDGRERAVSRPGAMVVRAAPGRPVAGVDIAAFIKGLPDGRDTTRFTTANASGSTSQAAAISEAIEGGCDLLLIDEDSSATNLLVRDARMQRLVEREDEPITVLLDRVRALHDDLGVSTVLVMGGSGDYLDVADHVIQLTRYAPSDVTEAARGVARALPTERRPEAVDASGAPRDRHPVGASIRTRNEHGKRSVRPLATDRLLLGGVEVDLRDVADTLHERAQAHTLALALEALAERLTRGGTALRAAVEQLLGEVAADGLDVLDRDGRGVLAEVRALDLAAALNRVRGLEVR